MSDARKLLYGLWVATGVSIAGQWWDQRWHAAHAHFETAADQVEAHWLVWLGELALVVLALVGTKRGGIAATDYRLLSWVLMFLWAVTVAHFIAHALHSDPDVIHVLLLVGKVGAVAGVARVSLTSLRQPGTKATA